MTYFNTAAESIPPRCVGEALQNYWEHKQQGMRGRDAHFAEVEACREIAARMLGRKASEIGFCSCSSEAYNLLAGALDPGPDAEVVITDLDFPAGATPWLRLPRPPTVRLWRARSGVLHFEDLEPLLNERTQLVQVSLVSFLNGHRIAWAPLRDRVRRLAPQAVLAADLTQALGRVVLDGDDADIVVSSTHKWTLGIHGGCIVGIPESAASRLTSRAGGWHHLANAFGEDRFERAVPKPGAASFAVGMPNFAALYALNASLRYVESVGVTAIARHADPLVAQVHQGLQQLGIDPMAPAQPDLPCGIVAFRHTRAAEIHAALERAGIHVMHQAGRIRISVAGYNTAEDVERLFEVLEPVVTRAPEVR